MEASVKPASTVTPPTKRNANIDAIRGVAVLGILFMNIYFFGSSILGYVNHDVVPLHDTLTELFSHFFLEGRFISLFAILFGVGLAIQHDKLSALGGHAYAFMKSRLKWLLLFGVIHAIFIWYGDVLFTYALGGFVALRYLDLDNRQLFKKSAIFLAISLLTWTAMNIFSPEEPVIRGSNLFEENISSWSTSYAEQLMMQLVIFVAMILVIPLSTMWMTAGLMLLGIALYRKGVFEEGFSIKQLMLFAFATILLSTLDSFVSLASEFGLEAYSLGIVLMSAIPMALIYLHFIVKICQNRATVLAPLQKVGRLALSLYILQSVCGVLLFRHLSPELIRTLDRPDYMLIAIGFSIFQVVLASVYLRYFNQGPLEWLWRKLVSKKSTKQATTSIPVTE